MRVDSNFREIIQAATDSEMIERIIEWKKDTAFDLSFVYLLKDLLANFGKLNRTQKLSLENIYRKCEADSRQPIS